MADFFVRAFALNLGGVLIAGEGDETGPRQPLRITFNIDRDLSREANSAEITVYNLSEKTRGLVEETELLTTLEAGYVGNISTIFSGKLEYGNTSKEGNDWITNFQSTDGGRELRSARINLSLAGGVDVKEVMRRAAEAMGLALGNVVDRIKEGNLRGALQEFGNGIVLSGNATDQFDKMAKTLGYEWSVQNGQIQVLEPGGIIDPDDSYKLTPGTGLIGSPQTGENGSLEVRSLLAPSLTPGRQVEIESREIAGRFRIERVVFNGDTRAVPWYADLEVKPT